MGKGTRKDETRGKLTYPTLLGLQASRDLSEQLIGEAKDRIAVFGERGAFLRELAEFVVARRN